MGGGTLSDTQPLDVDAEPGGETAPLDLYGETQAIAPPSILNNETLISNGLGPSELGDPQVGMETVVSTPLDLTAPLPVASSSSSRLPLFMVLGTLAVAGATWGALTLFAQPEAQVAAAPSIPDPIREPPPPPVAPPPAPSEPVKDKPVEVAAPEPTKPPEAKPAEPEAKPEPTPEPVAVKPPPEPAPRPIAARPVEPAPRPKPKPVEPVVVAPKPPVKPQPQPVTAKPPPPPPVKVAKTPAPTPAPEPAKEPAGAPSKLDVNCIPWCHIYVDGKDTGKNSPAFGLEVPAGAHKVKVVNPPTGLTQERDVTCTAGQATKVVVRFE